MALLTLVQTCVLGYDLQAIEVRMDAKIYSTHNFSTRLSVSTQQQSKQSGQNICGPVLRTILLTCF